MGTNSLFIFISLCSVFLVAEEKDRNFLFLLVLGAWSLGLPLLAVINYWLPFSGGGDDWNYYQLAGNTSIEAWSDLFDFSRFRHSMAQPGYPWLLSLVNHLSGQSLFVFKSLNLLFLILLALVWYRIGGILAGNSFGRKMACFVVCCTPLWFYVFFLLKDLMITLLQSMFLFGLAQNKVKNNYQSWVLIIAATLSLTLFRAPLVLANIALVFCVHILTVVKRKITPGALIQLILSLSFVTLSLFILSSPSYMNKFGIFTETRMIGTNGGMVEMGQAIHSASDIKRELFPILYILNDISGFNPESWKTLDASWLRGLTFIPWVVFGIPLLFLGARGLISHNLTTKNIPGGKRLTQGNGLRFRMFTESPWSILGLFIFNYFCISWQVGDTTRWRLPDIPVLSAVILYGWCFSPKERRNRTVLGWLVAIAAFASLIYLLREIHLTNIA